MKFDYSGLDDYMVDNELEDAGVWLEIPGDRRILARRAGGGNDAFWRARDAALRPYRAELRDGTLDQPTYTKVLLRVYTKHVFADWEGFCDENGNEVPYSPEACMQFLEPVPDLFDYLVGKCSERAHYLKEEVEKAKKPVAVVSSGN